MNDEDVAASPTFSPRERVEPINAIVVNNSLKEKKKKKSWLLHTSDW